MPAPIQYQADVHRVMVVTSTLVIEGQIHLPKIGVDDRRLTVFLNSDKKFMAMTDVQIIDRLTNKPIPGRIPFIEVSMATVEMVRPIDIPATSEVR